MGEQGLCHADGLVRVPGGAGRLDQLDKKRPLALRQKVQVGGPLVVKRIEDRKRFAGVSGLDQLRGEQLVFAAGEVEPLDLFGAKGVLRLPPGAGPDEDQLPLTHALRPAFIDLPAAQHEYLRPVQALLQRGWVERTCW